MRERVMRFRHADLRIRSRALLLAEHERDDARQIGLEREHLQIHHQRQVIFEHRRRAQRAGPARAARYCSASPPSECGARRREPHRRIHRPCLDPAGPSSCLRLRELAGDGIENALVLLQGGFRARPGPCCRCRRTASRRRYADSIPWAEAAWGCARRACRDTRSSDCRCTRPHWPAGPWTFRATPTEFPARSAVPAVDRWKRRQ